jgi:hypothetical protein
MSFRLYRTPSSTPYLISPVLISSPVAASSPAPASQSFQDIHVYDYSYKDQPYTPLVTENHIEWIQRLLPKMRNPVAIQGVQLILSNTGNLANFDTTNQKRAEDLLADLAYVILTKDTDLLELLEEQMADMYQLGQCAQGRVTRLWQLRETLG